MDIFDKALLALKKKYNISDEDYKKIRHKMVQEFCYQHATGYKNGLEYYLKEMPKDE